MKRTLRVVSVILALALIMSAAFIVSQAESPLNYVVLGDSIAYGSGVKNPKEACYGKIIADTCGYDYINYGIPGHTTQDLLNILEHDDVLASIEEADIISISIGGNNFLMGGLPMLIFDSVVKKDYSRFDEIAANFNTDIRTIVGIIKAENPDAKLLLQTLYNPMPGSLRDDYQQGADRINAMLYAFHAENPDSFELIDVAGALGDDQSMYAMDFMHPGAQGNVVIAQTLLAALRADGLTDASELVINNPGEETGSIVVRTIALYFIELFANISAKLAG